MNFTCLVTQKCPRDRYIHCPAFELKKNCWQVSGIPCCRRNIKSRCLDCDVYLASTAGQILPRDFIRPNMQL